MLTATNTHSTHTHYSVTALDQKGAKMKISATIPDEEFDRIEKYIDCREWANPMQDLFLFYDPAPKFLTMLCLFNIEFHKEE